MIMWYVLSQNWRLTCMFATTSALLLMESSCSHVLSSLFDYFCTKTTYVWFELFALDGNSLNVPTTNNLNRIFLLIHYRFFNILNLFSGRQSWVIYTPGIHTGTSTFTHICHDIINSVLSSKCSKTFWLVSWSYYGFTALRHILGHFKRGQLAYPHVLSKPPRKLTCT